MPICSFSAVHLAYLSRSHRSIKDPERLVNLAGRSFRPSWHSKQLAPSCGSSSSHGQALTVQRPRARATLAPTQASAPKSSGPPESTGGLSLPSSGPTLSSFSGAVPPCPPSEVLLKHIPQRSPEKCGLPKALRGCTRPSQQPADDAHQGASPGCRRGPFALWRGSRSWGSHPCPSQSGSTPCSHAKLLRCREHHKSSIALASYHSCAHHRSRISISAPKPPAIPHLRHSPPCPKPRLEADVQPKWRPTPRQARKPQAVRLSWPLFSPVRNRVSGARGAGARKQGASAASDSAARTRMASCKPRPQAQTRPKPSKKPLGHLLDTFKPMDK